MHICDIGKPMAPFGLHETTVNQGALGHRIDITWNGNVKAIDWEEAFLSYYDRKDSKGDYIGLGKTILALANWAANDPRPEVVDLKRHLVRRIIETQEPAGYIGGHGAAYRSSRLWDVHETSHIIWGLVADFVNHSESDSLDAARKAADYLEESLTPGVVAELKRYREKKRPEDRGLHVCLELGTIDYERALLEMYKATREPAYLDRIGRFGFHTWDRDIVLGRRDGVAGHAYAYFARSIVQLELYRITGDERLWAQTRRVMDFLLGGGGLTITGAMGHYECWHNDQEGRGELGETCASAYFIELLDVLAQLTGNSLCGDLMERVIHNTLFAGQSPDGRLIRYYVPFDGTRVYFDEDTFCCPNNYRWIISLLPKFVFYRVGRGIAVNLYTPSDLETTLEDGTPVRLHVETDYPSSGRVSIEVHPSRPSRFPIRLRIPRWCKQATLAVNGEECPAPAPGSFAEIEREFAPGDLIELTMEMPWRLVKGFRSQYGRVAVMRGPQLFCYAPDRNQHLADFPPVALRIDPATFDRPAPDDSLRPGGLLAKLKCHHWQQQDLVLSEYPEPEGTATYFLSTDPSQAEDDELLDREALARSSEARRISGVVPSTVDADAPEASWHGLEVLDYDLWMGGVE